MAQKNELADLLDILSKFPEGIPISKILELVENKYSKRTLQRNLAKLILQNQAICVGEKKATVYKAVKIMSSSETFDFRFQKKEL